MDNYRFCNLTDEEKKCTSHEDYTISEIMEIISETVLSDTDREIANLRFTKKMTYEAIAEIVDRDCKTVQKRVKEISKKLKITAYRLLLQKK